MSREIGLNQVYIWLLEVMKVLGSAYSFFEPYARRHSGFNTFSSSFFTNFALVLIIFSIFFLQHCGGAWGCSRVCVTNFRW